MPGFQDVRQTMSPDNLFQPEPRLTAWLDSSISEQNGYHVIGQI